MLFLWLILAATLSNAEPPKLCQPLTPEYPREAQIAGVTAIISVFAKIDIHGVATVEHLGRPSGFGFDELAREAVSKAQFSPGHRDGQPVASTTLVEVPFLPTRKSAPTARMGFQLVDGASRPVLDEGKYVPAFIPGNIQKVRLAFRVSRYGSVTDLKVTQAFHPIRGIVHAVPEELLPEILLEFESVRGWRFRPAIVNNEPVDVAGGLEVDYSPQRAALTLASPEGCKPKP